MFEYHFMDIWKTVQLEDVVHVLDLHDFDCYFQGNARLWPITGKSSVATVSCSFLRGYYFSCCNIRIPLLSSYSNFSLFKYIYIVGSCWDARYEFKFWSNVLCVLRGDVWHTVIQKYVPLNGMQQLSRHSNNSRIPQYI